MNLENEMQIGAQIRRTVVIKSILDTSKVKFEKQIEMKWYLLLSVLQLGKIATRRHKLR